MIEDRFLQELRHHLIGLQEKVINDFGEENYQRELRSLQDDPLYSRFGLAIPEYVLIRLMGRVSISIGRRLGEIYDKIPRFVTASRFGLQTNDIVLKFGQLELDIGINLSALSSDDSKHVSSVTSNQFRSFSDKYVGLGIEIRYNFNPNDSARLRKDVQIGSLLAEANFFPIYLIFSEISPRQEAIDRLSRAGWNFLIGRDADIFMFDLIGMDIGSILDRPKVQSEINNEIDSLMTSLLSSAAFRYGARLA